jgi:hypothetical protein
MPLILPSCACVVVFAVEPIIILNSAFCERHLKNCPPTEELTRECNRAHELEQELDEAFKNLKLPDPCVNRAKECEWWASVGERGSRAVSWVASGGRLWGRLCCAEEWAAGGRGTGHTYVHASLGQGMCLAGESRACSMRTSCGCRVLDSSCGCGWVALEWVQQCIQSSLLLGRTLDGWCNLEMLQGSADRHGMIG